MLAYGLQNEARLRQCDFDADRRVARGADYRNGLRTHLRGTGKQLVGLRNRVPVREQLAGK
jgi:hypothetical protein